MRPSAKLLTVREVADRLGLKESTIRKRILQRQIAYVKPSLRAVRIPIEELDRILTAGCRPVVSPHATTSPARIEGLSHRIINGSRRDAA